MPFVVLACLALPGSLRPNEGPKHRLTVLTFKQGAGVTQSEAGSVTSQLSARLVRSGAFDIIEREDLREILKEKALQRSGITESEYAARIGRVLSVSKIVLGEIYRVQGTYMIAARLVDVQTGKIELSASESANGFSAFPEATASLSAQIVGSYGQRQPLPATGNAADRWSYTWRAMVFPGYGHFYGRNNLRGGIYSLLFVSALANYTVKNDEVHRDPNASEDDLTGRKIERGRAVVLLGFVYALNILDAALYAGTNDWFFVHVSRDFDSAGFTLEQRPGHEAPRAGTRPVLASRITLRYMFTF